MSQRNTEIKEIKALCATPCRCVSIGSTWLLDELKVQECDATVFNQGTTVWFKKGIT